MWMKNEYNDSLCKWKHFSAKPNKVQRTKATWIKLNLIISLCEVAGKPFIKSSKKNFCTQTQSMNFRTLEDNICLSVDFCLLLFHSRDTWSTYRRKQRECKHFLKRRTRALQHELWKHVSGYVVKRKCYASGLQRTLCWLQARRNVYLRDRFQNHVQISWRLVRVTRILIQN